MMDLDQLRDAFREREAKAPTFHVDPDGLILQGRRAGKRRGIVLAASCLAVAVIVAVAGVIISAKPKAGGTASITTVTPSPAVGSDFANLYQNCQVRILDAALTEPFWLSGNHFDPPGRRRSPHTASEVAQAYRNNRMSHVLPGPPLRVARAMFTQSGGAARPVWIVVTTSNSETGQSSTPLMDYVSIFEDQDQLRYVGTIVENLPGHCQ